MSQQKWALVSKLGLSWRAKRTFNHWTFSTVPKICVYGGQRDESLSKKAPYESLQVIVWTLGTHIKCQDAVCLQKFPRQRAYLKQQVSSSGSHSGLVQVSADLLSSNYPFPLQDCIRLNSKIKIYCKDWSTQCICYLLGCSRFKNYFANPSQVLTTSTEEKFSEHICLFQVFVPYINRSCCID